MPTIEVFLCYAREDKAFLQELEDHLAPLKRQGLITSWHDGDIRVGTEWEQEIKAHLDTAQLVLLLVSPSFMNSDYAYGTEMTQALERQSRNESRVIPVIVRPVYWQGEPLGKLQALPADGKPVTSWPNHDEAFHNVVEGIRAVIGEFLCSQWINTGNDFLKDRRYEDALAAFKKAIALAPHSADAYQAQGDVLYYLGRYEDALISYQQVRSADPSIVLKQGQCLLRLRLYEDALTVYEEIIRQNAKEAQAHAYRGYTLFLLKRYEEASTSCEQALRLDPKSALGHYLFCSVLTSLQLHQQAFSVYERASSLQFGGALTYFAKGDALAHLERYAEALAAYVQAQQIAPNDPWIYEHQGDTLQHLERYEEALSAYEKAIHHDSSDPTLYHKKALVLEQLTQRAHITAKERGYGDGTSLDSELHPPIPSQVSLSLTTLDNLALIQVLQFDRIAAVAISPNGQFVASTNSDFISIWDLHTGGTLIGNTSSLSGYNFNSFLAFDLDSYIVVTGNGIQSGSGRSPSFLLWNPYNVQYLGCLEYQYQDGYGTCGAFSPDRKTFIGACHFVSAWNWHNKANLLKQTQDWGNEHRWSIRGYAGHYPQTTSLAFSPDGHMFVSGGSYGDIIIWDAHTMQAIRTITGHQDAIQCLVVDPNGQTLVSGSDDTTIKIWNLQSGKLLYTLEGHTAAIRTLMISSDGQTLFSAGEDNTLRLWDVHRGVPLRMIALPQEKQPGVISTAAVTSEGKLFVASIDGKTIKIWGNQ